MKTRILSFVALSLFIFSCGAEEESKKSEKITPNKNDSTEINSDSLNEEVAEPRVRLPKHAGSWIDSNLDNPVFYSEKVDEWVVKSLAKFEEPQEAVADYEFDFLNEKEIKKLTVRELIYYSLAYPASFSQICAEPMYDTTADVPKIYGYIPFSYEAEEMSYIQYNEIKRRRDSVIIVLCNYIEENPNRIDVEYLQLLRSLDAYEAFPSIMATASQKNANNYAFLLEFMRQHEYPAFTQTDFYEKLYGESSYYSGNSIPSTPALRKKIIQLAKDFYQMNNAD